MFNHDKKKHWEEKLKKILFPLLSILIALLSHILFLQIVIMFCRKLLGQITLYILLWKAWQTFFLNYFCSTLKRTGFYVEQRNRYQYISCTITIYHDHQKFKKTKQIYSMQQNFGFMHSLTWYFYIFYATVRWPDLGLNSAKLAIQVSRYLSLRRTFHVSKMLSKGNAFNRP